MPDVLSASPEAAAASVSEINLPRRLMQVVAALASAQDRRFLMPPRQTELMILVYTTPHPLEVKYLAERLACSKPVITRAMNTLIGRGYMLRRRLDGADKRKVFAMRTAEGRRYLESLSRGSGYVT